MSKRLNINPVQQITDPEIVVASFNEAKNLLATGKKWPRFDSIISIGDPGSKPPQGFRFVPYRLRLEFDDIEEEMVENDEELKPPSEDDINELISFAKLSRDRGDSRVLIHCQAGHNRSTAAAFIFLCIWLGNGRESEAVKKMLDSCTEADENRICPNVLMIEIADDLLHKDGRMGETFDEFFPDD